jgi:hypothetical protein
MSKPKTKGLWKINTLLTIAGKMQWMKLDKAAKNCKKAQEKTLRQILEYAKDSVYGKEHNFAKILEAKTPEELFKRYQENVKALGLPIFAATPIFYELRRLCRNVITGYLDSVEQIVAL